MRPAGCSTVTVNGDEVTGLKLASPPYEAVKVVVPSGRLDTVAFAIE